MGKLNLAVPADGRVVNDELTYLINNAVYNVKDFGAKGDGVRDDTGSIQNAIDACVRGGGGVVLFPVGTYKISSTLQISLSKVRISGASWAGCALNFIGTSALFQIGTDDGLSWDLGNYNGIQGVAFENLSMEYTGTAVALNNGFGSYGANTYGIRDWRGGKVRIDRCTISQFDYPFWGVQSDLNYFSDLLLKRNHSGLYLGPRSDQGTIDTVWSFNNDRVFWFEGCSNTHVRKWSSDTDGSATTCPVLIGNSQSGVGPNAAHFAGTRVHADNTFSSPWLESVGAGAIDVPAFFDVGNGDTTQGGSVHIHDPSVFVSLYSTGGASHVFYLCRVGYTRSVAVTGMSGRPGQVPWSNLRSVFSVLANASGGGATTPYLFFSDYDVNTARLVENYHANTVKVNVIGDSDASYSNNVVGGTGTVTLYGGRNAPRNFLSAAATWDPPSIASGAQTTTTIAVSGCTFSDTVIATLQRDMLGLSISGYVSSAGTVTVVLSNLTGAPVDLNSATLRVDVIQH
jgi:hypothetical protein